MMAVAMVIMVAMVMAMRSGVMGMRRDIIMRSIVGVRLFIKHMFMGIWTRRRMLEMLPAISIITVIKLTSRMNAGSLRLVFSFSKILH